MKHLACGTLSAALLFTLIPIAYAEDSPEDVCRSTYSIPTRTINFVEESTGHDPRQFLVRRCISTVRKELAKQRSVERQQLREASRYDRTSAIVHQRAETIEKGVQSAIRRQNLKEQRFRSSTHTLDKTPFIEGRQSRRSLIRGTEGYDRINAIRRKLMSEKQVDPCTVVLAIRKYNNPCRRYGSLRNEQ